MLWNFNEKCSCVIEHHTMWYEKNNSMNNRPVCSKLNVKLTQSKLQRNLKKCFQVFRYVATIKKRKSSPFQLQRFNLAPFYVWCGGLWPTIPSIIEQLIPSSPFFWQGGQLKLWIIKLPVMFQYDLFTLSPSFPREIPLKFDIRSPQKPFYVWTGNDNTVIKVRSKIKKLLFIV